MQLLIINLCSDSHNSPLLCCIAVTISLWSLYGTTFDNACISVFTGITPWRDVFISWNIFNLDIKIGMNS